MNWPFNSLKEKLKNKDAIQKHRDWLKKWLFGGLTIYVAAALVVLVTSFALLRFVVLTPNQPVTNDTGNKIENHQQVNEPIEQPKEMPIEERHSAELPEPQIDLSQLVLPVNGEVLLTYHEPYFSDVYNDYRISEGLKFEVSVSKEVKAALPGKVLSTEKDPYNGYTVTIDHGQGYQTKYTGLSEVQVNVNQQIDQRGVIGTSGGEDNPQVRFTLMQNGQPINPL